MSAKHIFACETLIPARAAVSNGEAGKRLTRPQCLGMAVTELLTERSFRLAQQGQSFCRSFGDQCFAKTFARYGEPPLRSL
jgi:hypothetical protein